MTRPASLERLIEAVSSATDDLLATVARLSDEVVRRPSALPGWSVGHVLAHVARNADGMVNLCTWARTGVPTPAYASPESRNSDIEAGAGRPAAAHADDIAAGAARLREAFDAIPDANWDAEVAWPSGRTRPGRMIVVARLNEVETHHVDLALGRTFDDVPAGLHDVLLDYATSNLPAGTGLALRNDDTGWSWPADAAGARIVSGTGGALLGWVLGRTDGSDLPHEGPLPSLPAWG